MSLASVLDRAVRLHGSRPAIIEPDHTYTWAEFGDRVQRAASVLADRGIDAGDRFGIMALNGFHQAEVMHAGYWMGAIPVPINTRLAPPEIRQIFDDAACKIVVVDDACAGALESPDLSRWHERSLSLDGDYETLLTAASPCAAHDSADDDDAILLYTGGTTGRSKGVRLTHRNVVSNGMQVALATGARIDDVFLHVAPMFHSADLLGTAYTLMGAAHAYLPRFTPESVLQAIARSGTTAVLLTPTMIIMTLQGEDVSAYDVSKLRLILYGSSPMALEWIRRAAEAFQSTGIQQLYGLTETSPVLTSLDAEVHANAFATGETGLLRSVGRAVADVSLHILNDEGNEVPIGEMGEVSVRGPNIAAGYLNRPELTNTAFRGGWFRTGDVGRIDENGYLYLLDRKNDVIITGGENVFSSEVEAVLYQHAGVAEAAVIGVPDERYGEALLAAIVPARGATLTDAEMIAHCRDKIGGYKIPRRFAFLDELPKSAMGKILKTELRKTYAKSAEEAK